MGLRSDQRGSVTVVTALAATSLLGAAAIGLDLSVVYSAQRRAQGAADLAAISAASDPSVADAAAKLSLAANGYPDSTRIGVQAGSFLRDVSIASDKRFTPGGASPNAVRVSLTAPVRLTFGRVLGLPATYDVAVTSTAANTRFAAFSIGSGAASLNAGIANAVLGSMLGTTLSLSALDYDALLSARLDAFRFLDALATDLNLTAATYTDILTAGVTPGQIAGALAGALASTAAATNASTALRSLTKALKRSTDRIPLRDIVDLGDAALLSPDRGSSGPAIRLFDIVSAMAAIANGDRQVSVDLGLSLPGLLGTRLTLAVGEQRSSSGWVSPGSARATLRTGQVRLLIETQLKAPLNLGTLSLPLYVEAAMGQASLRGVSCGGAGGNGRRVDLDVQPGLVSLAIGEVGPASFSTKTPPPALTEPADLLRLPLLGLAIRASAQSRIGSTYAQRVSFSEDDISRHRERTVSTTGLLSSATGSLLGSLNLEINGAGALLLPTLRPLLITTLSAVAPALDTVLDGTLRTLGVQLGTVTATAEGARCEQAVLVQ
ncbi:MAG TPA: pilus assembly protein TadG-related protein [Methylorubrum populi]|uniref:Pilus assembly protein TadG-related protein n=1 Tax=Methylorubrum populi TaxID=223967 RepID=A0A921E4R3_9HYPH|nr:pilus assembly protein TadG-related protein [Methylorubrum populi]